eukprot:6004781-Ditylum_brightwellii.AAC.1
MDLWEEGWYGGLVEESITEGRAREERQCYRRDDEASKARRFNSTVLLGKLRAAVRAATEQEKGGVLFPSDACTKTGQTVLEVLRGKHPHTRTPDLSDLECTAFEQYALLLEAVPLDISAEDVERVASRLAGSVGQGGTDAIELRNWLLRYGA